LNSSDLSCLFGPDNKSDRIHYLSKCFSKSADSSDLLYMTRNENEGGIWNYDIL